MQKENCNENNEKTFNVLEFVEGLNYVTDDYPYCIYTRKGEDLLRDGDPVSHVYRLGTFRIKKLTIKDLKVGDVIYRRNKRGQDCRVIAFYKNAAVLGYGDHVFTLKDDDFLNNCWAKR